MVVLRRRPASAEHDFEALFRIGLSELATPVELEPTGPSAAELSPLPAG